MIDFMYVTELLRTETHDLFGLETAMEEQVGESLLASVSKYHLEILPHLNTVGRIFYK